MLYTASDLLPFSKKYGILKLMNLVLFFSCNLLILDGFLLKKSLKYPCKKKYSELYYSQLIQEHHLQKRRCYADFDEENRKSLTG